MIKRSQTENWCGTPTLTETETETRTHTEQQCYGSEIARLALSVECSSNANIAYMHEMFGWLAFRSVPSCMEYRYELKWAESTEILLVDVADAVAVAVAVAGAGAGNGDGAVIAKMKENKNRYQNQLMVRLPRFCCPFLMARRLRVPHTLSLSFLHISKHIHIYIF